MSQVVQHLFKEREFSRKPIGGALGHFDRNAWDVPREFDQTVINQMAFSEALRPNNHSASKSVAYPFYYVTDALLNRWCRQEIFGCFDRVFIFWRGRQSRCSHKLMAFLRWMAGAWRYLLMRVAEGGSFRCVSSEGSASAEGPVTFASRAKRLASRLFVS